MKNLFIIFLFLFPALSFAQTDEAKEYLKKIFTDDKIEYQKIFDKSVFKAVSEEKLKEIVNEYKTKLGELNYIDGKDGVYDVICKNGKTESKVTLNKENLIVGFWFGQLNLFNDTLETIVEELKKHEGTLSINIVKNNKDKVFALNETEPLGVGSAFKLFVLKALNEKIKQKKAKWETVIKTDKNYFSLPSGFLQTWEDKSPITLKSLANLMISISDNTATDLLITYLGRDFVEKYSPKRVSPFLKTSEMFKLKWGVDKKVTENFINGSPKEKLQILKDIEKFDINKVKFDASPTLISKLEWFISAKELCEVIYDVKDNTALQINTGIGLKKDKWNYVGYKGGSEPGVLNLTFLVQKEKISDYYCVSVTLNNESKEVDQKKIIELVSRLVVLIENKKI